MMRRTLLTLLLASALPVAAAAAPAPAATGRSGDELTGWLILGEGFGYGAGYQYGIGVGGRYRLSVVPEGLIHQTRSGVRDTVDAEFGADLVRYSYGYHVPPFDYSYSWTSFRPRAGLMWNFWLTPRFALYPKLDLGYEFGWFSGWDPNLPRPTYAGFFLEPSLGLIYQFRPATDLRVELGTEGLKLGLGFAF